MQSEQVELTWIVNNADDHLGKGAWCKKKWKKRWWFDEEEGKLWHEYRGGVEGEQEGGASGGFEAQTNLT